MKISLFSFLDLFASANVLLQVKSEPSVISPTLLIIISLLILTIIVIGSSYYYWQEKRNQTYRERYQIKSIKLIKNGRKYTKKETA